MEENNQTPPQQDALLFKSPDEALKALRDDYLYWGERVTSSSFELSIAVIAANWAAFGNWITIKSNVCAQASLVIVILGIAIGLLGARWMAELHRARIQHAEKNHLNWQLEYKQTAESNDPWPYTSKIENLGYLLRLAKAWLPLIGGAVFIFALIK
jgi:hypothetical protein